MDSAKHIVYPLYVFMLICGMLLFGSRSAVAGTQGNAENEFDAGKFVIEHVSDSYEWHIATFGEKHISIPLPVILYSKTQGFQVFMSSKFHHGTESHNGFFIAREGRYEGKIVETDANGHQQRPLDLSITKTVSGIIMGSVLIVFIFLHIARKARKNKGKTPKGLQNAIEPVIIFVRDEIATPSIGEKKTDRFMPYLLTVFFFILLNNLFGLIPIFPFGANVTGNISVTLVLALFTFMVTNISGNRHYWKEIFNPDVPMFMKLPIPIMPFVEILGAIIKPFVLMVRLFANMLAGHLIITVFISLIFIFASRMGNVAGLVISPVSILFSIFIFVLDILVSFIQAYVFTLLTALYIGAATSEHH